MRCSYPILVHNKSGELVQVPCGQCKACRINYKNSWKMRFDHELKAHDFNSWIELSYDDEHLNKQNEIYSKIDGKIDSLERPELTKFFKRLRKELYPRKVRYFGCGEYGDNLRPHYHVALFGVSPDDKVFGKRIMNAKTGYWYDMPSWPFGMVWVDDNPPTLQAGAYIAKYIMKKHKGKGAKDYYEHLNINPEFVCMSLRPGIGAQKIDEFADYYMDNPVYSLNGHKVALTRYMKERIAKKYADTAVKSCQSEDKQEAYDVAKEQVLQSFKNKMKEHNEKYGKPARKFETCGEQWRNFGQQQERNLKQ